MRNSAYITIFIVFEAEIGCLSAWVSFINFHMDVSLIVL